MPKYGYTKFDIPDGSEAGQAILAARALVSDADLAGHGKDIGATHITLRYGLMDDFILELEAFLSAQIPFQVVLGSSASFPPSPSSDNAAVLIAPVSSPALHELNESVAEHAAFAPSDFDYSPHATIAYLQPEQLCQYEGMEVTNGKRFTVYEVTICPLDQPPIIVKLGGIGHRYNEDQPRDEHGRFGSNGLSESEQSTALSALDKLDQLHEKDAFGNEAFPGQDNVAVRDVYPVAPVRILYGIQDREQKRGRDEVMAVKDLTPSQEHIPREGLRAYIKNLPEEKPEVISYQGREFLISGTTRVGAQILAGRTEVSVRHFKVDDKGKVVKWDTRNSVMPELEERFNDDQPRDDKGKWTSSGTSVDGDVKTTTYSSPNHSVTVIHNTKENKITVKHLDAKGNLLVQQTHDSVGAARKELTTQGIDHKFYATRASFNPEQEREPDGTFTMGNVATFTNEAKGLESFVTKYHGKFHVNATGVPGTIYSDKEKAIEKAKELIDLRYSDDQPRDPDGKFASGMSEKEAAAAYDTTVPAPDLGRWQAGEHQTMQGDSTSALKAGTPGKDPMLNAIRHERFDGMIYRGLSLDKDDPLLSLKGGGSEIIQLEPSSFSFDRGIADEFSTQTLMEGQVPVIISVGPWGNGIVVGDRGDPEYGPKGYDQKEVVTAGHFRVHESKNKIGPNGKYRFISLRQEGVF